MSGFQISHSRPNASARDRRRAERMAHGLLGVAAMTVLMAMLGGWVRLTQSGFAMAGWVEHGGWLPPLGEGEWAQAYERFRAIPALSGGGVEVGLSAFKSMFWLEYAHQMWARLMVVALVAGIAVYVRLGWVRFTDGVFWKLMGVVLLGVAQGAVGWAMAFGAADAATPWISQYRLTAHFGLAMLFFSSLVAVSLTLLHPRPHDRHHQSPGRLRGAGAAVAVLVFITALSGGFVAGVDAGYAYNTFPLMDGTLIPDGLFDHDPAWLAPFEHVTTVQFDHRVLGMVLLFAVLVFRVSAADRHLAPRTRLALNTLVTVAVAETALGAFTVVYVAPIPLASSHQLMALALLAAALWSVHELRGEAPGVRGGS
ncbi:MAG: COX15/CtaA family protein [Alphaproteobacteria bacterium]|nr:COX15/CtaA family protein [Alphaproteobacteria bacterium]